MPFGKLIKAAAQGAVRATKNVAGPAAQAVAKTTPNSRGIGRLIQQAVLGAKHVAVPAAQAVAKTTPNSRGMGRLIQQAVLGAKNVTGSAAQAMAKNAASSAAKTRPAGLGRVAAQVAQAARKGTMGLS